VVIPFAAPTRLQGDEAEAVRHAVDAVLSSDRWVLGPSVESFEREFAAYVGGGHVVGVGNGSDALAITFVACGLDEGEGILVPPNDGGFAAQSARAVGLRPVAYDVDLDTLGPTPESAAAVLDPGVRAIVATHLHGDPLDLSALDAWRLDARLVLIEDCAQAHGAHTGGQHVGRVGDAATFSFYPTKNLGAAGDGGAAVLHEEAAAQLASSLREYGWQRRYLVEHERGRNSRLDAVQAAVLSARLPHLDERNSRRRAIARRYADALAGSTGHLHGDLEHGVFHHAVVVDPRRDELSAHLDSAGVMTAVHYPYLAGEMPGLGLVDGETPVAGRLRDRMLSVPCFPEMSEDEVSTVVEALASWAGRRP
jgi:aminotransferase EvaB